jgi:phosphopantothenoylcysteine decarboxylase/phosphopantothenate--cysteine ligase
MNCIVTAGPTYEPLDTVRRLTNFSTGKLGVELANHLTIRGHQVTLFVGEQAVYPGKRWAAQVRMFSTTASLRAGLLALSGPPVEAVFHAAAVSDFTFGAVWQRSTAGELTGVKAGKIPTREGGLLVELIPTPKLILELRGWFPSARLAGWKFEVDGGPDDVLRAARLQLAEARTDVCVANGPAYGPGFGLVTAEGEKRVADASSLYAELEEFIRR